MEIAHCRLGDYEYKEFIFAVWKYVFDTAICTQQKLKFADVLSCLPKKTFDVFRLLDFYAVVVIGLEIPEEVLQEDIYFRLETKGIHLLICDA